MGGGLTLVCKDVQLGEHPHYCYQSHLSCFHIKSVFTNFLY